jgi:SM-20-related protein
VVAAESEPILEIIEDLVSADLHSRACDVCRGKSWYFGHGSHEGDSLPFWKMDLDGNAVFDEIWSGVRERCEKIAGGPLRVIRQYANGHTYGLGGKPHPDDVRPGSFTLLYYPMPEWKDGWDGETVFFDEHGEIALAVRPRPNRAVFFDSRILHAGRAPSRACPSLRVTVAYKLECVDAPPTEAESEWSIDEAGREGASRIWRLRMRAAAVERLIAERLNEIAQTVRLPGFRPGKIPADVVRQRYGEKARAEVLSRIAAQAGAHVLARGSLVSEVSMVAGAQGGDLELRLSATHLPDLPPLDTASIQLERLTSDDPAMAGALADHLRQQVMDRLDAAYDFPVAPALIEREFAAIRGAAEQQGGAITAEIEAELRVIAERRVRLGAVVAELARRWVFGREGMEDKVVARILESAQITERPATKEELADFSL